MRRRASAEPVPRPLVTATFPSYAAAAFSLDDQKRQVLQIARGFKEHYLAEVRYLADRQTTVATIQPTHPRHQPHYICIDAAGNVDIVPCHPSLPPRHIARRLMLALGSLLTVLSLSVLFL